MKNDDRTQVRESSSDRPSDGIPVLSPEAQARWDSWVDAKIGTAISENNTMLADAFGAETGAEDGKLWKECKKLRGRIAKQHAQIILLRSEVATLQKSRAKTVKARAIAKLGGLRRRLD